MPCAPAVAHRASRHLRRPIPVVAALAVAAAATVTVTTPAQAAYSPRVVIVVGPTHGSTANYLEHARAYARQARAYGAVVETEIHDEEAVREYTLEQSITLYEAAGLTKVHALRNFTFNPATAEDQRSQNRFPLFRAMLQLTPSSPPPRPAPARRSAPPRRGRACGHRGRSA